MPVLIEQHDDFRDLLESSWSDERRVVTVGGEATTAGWELASHSHEKPQLLLVLSGVVTCEVEAGIWLVPPGSALFIASGMAHRLVIAGAVQTYVVLFGSTAASALPPNVCSLSVSPLLRALILKSAQFSMHSDSTSTEHHVSELLVSEVAAAKTGNLHLPMPTDSRLRKIFAEIMANPSARGTIESWSRQVALSERSLERLIVAETGLSFGRWRQQLNILMALRWMAEGSTVQQAASDLGYESTGSLVTAFRKVLGTTPGRYMAERQS